MGSGAAQADAGPIARPSRGMVLLFLHLRLDMFMLNSMAGASALGIYSLSVTLAETVQLGTDSVAIAILPRQMGNSLQERP